MLKNQKKMQIKHDCHYAIVFCTKYRKEILIDEIKETLAEQLVVFFEQEGLSLNGYCIESNYVYLQVSIDPQLSVSQVVRRLKVETSTILKQNFKKLTQVLPSIWTFNYWCTTKGPLTESMILEYVETQPKR